VWEAQERIKAIEAELLTLCAERDRVNARVAELQQERASILGQAVSHGLIELRKLGRVDYDKARKSGRSVWLVQ
jgi:chorismate mutase